MNLPIQVDIILWLAVIAAAVGLAGLTISTYVSAFKTWKSRKHPL